MTKKIDIVSLVDKCTEHEDTQEWSGILKDYLPKVVKNPELNETAHARIWRMVESQGISFEEKDDNKNEPHYGFFENELFGVDHVLSQVMQYFKASAAGSEVNKRLLLLWGPTSSGKSEFATLLKKGLEEFSRTKEGCIYAIQGCPMHENPLNAIPQSARKVLNDKYGILVNGTLCPKCAYRLKNELNGDFWSFPVERIFLSEMDRIGIGTFQPADVKCIDGQSLVVTDKGIKKIKDLGQHNEENINIKVLNSDGEFVRANTFFKYENKKVKKIKTQLGYEITCSLNHPLRTVNRNGDLTWKLASNINVEDNLVLFCQDVYDHMNKSELPENVLNIKWTSNFAKFLGLYLSEGYMRRNTIEIAASNSNIRQIVKDALCEININNWIEREDRVTVSNKDLVQFMLSLGFKIGSRNKDLPNVVFSSPFVKDIVCGMWLGDGNVGKHASKNTNEAVYGSASLQLIQQLQSLLLLFGIPSAISKNYKKEYDHTYNKLIISSFYVKSFVEKFNIPEWKMTRKLENIKVNSNVFNLPHIDELMTNMGCRQWKGANWLPYLNKSRMGFEKAEGFVKDAKKNGADKDLIFKLENLLKNKIYLNVVDITESTDDVYDIEVPSCHEFVANGFISHNSQSQSELVGSVNFAKLEEFGVESHPLAYSFDGELNISNRGMMEFIELLKVDEKFRHILLTLTQEKRIKTERFPLIFADEVVLGHTNETEYNKFIGDKKQEALHDRLWVVRFPYNLKVDDEMKIYEKLICNTPGFKDIYIAPHTLKVAAIFAILSRLEEPKDKSVTLLQKMQLYNGEEVEGFTPQNVKELQQATVREGLDGISPRYIVNRLAACFAKHDVKTVTPISAIRSIKDGFSTNAKLDGDEINRLEQLTIECIEEYNKIACNEVQRAFFVNFEHEIKNLLSNYIDNVGAYLDDSKVENEWGDLVEHDERLLRNIEEKIGITSTGKDSFREEVYRRMMRSKSEKGTYEYESHPKLKEALQKQLFDERKDVIKLTVSSRNPDPEGLKKLNEVVSVLVDKYGYNAESANELLRYVSNIMSKSK